MLASRIVFELALILGLPLLAYASDPYPDCRTPTLKTYNLLGPVRSVKTEISEADGKDRKLIGARSFDRAGRLLEEKHRSLVGEPERQGYQVFRYIYKPQSPDYEVDMFEIDPAQGEKPIDFQRHFVEFDSLGHCVEESTVDNEGSLDRKTYEYDSQGNLINEVYHNADGTTSSVVRTYGGNHQLLSEQGIGWTSDFLRVYRYDTRGNRTDEFDYEDGALEYHRVFRYDDHNRVISAVTVVDPSKDAHAYGRCGDCGPSSGRTVYTYDDAKGTIKEEMFDSSNKLVRTHYEFYAAHSNQANAQPNGELYDSHRNWIRAKSHNNEGVYIYRVIDYY